MAIVSLTPTVVSALALPGGPPGPQGPPGASSLFGINAQAGVASYLSSGDFGKLIIFSGTILGVIFSLPAPVGVPGWWCIIKNNNVSGVISVSVPTAATIDGNPTLTIDPACSAYLVFNGQNFETIGLVDGGSF